METNTISSAGTAAREYIPAEADVQILVASVSKPVGRSSNVAGSSFIAVRNTRAIPAAAGRARSGRTTRRNTADGPRPSVRPASSTRGLSCSRPDFSGSATCGRKSTT
jgi:hypothetical protein